ncbi:MAG: LamG-like jellyroll fold domain-containing protein [Bacteroidota bacterium]|nr:LamG-like jellyroll fold domain-containing protein [Bacteroidota bacterium]
MLDNSASPLRQFALVTDFLAAVRGLSPNWLASYAAELFPHIRHVVGHNYVAGGEPQRWLLLLAWMDLADRHAWVQSTAMLEDARFEVLKKLILSFACVRAYRDLHALLQSRGYDLRGMTEEAWSAIMNADTIGDDPLQRYATEATPEGDEPPHPLSAAVREWKLTRNEEEVGVVLLDVETGGAGTSGTVLHLALQSRRAPVSHVHFAGDLPADNTETMRQLVRCATLAEDLVQKCFGMTPPPREYTFTFHEHAAAFSGESMGLAAALQLSVYMQRGFNRGARWHLPRGMACIGGLQEDGRLQEAPSPILRRKIEVAFFSPVSSVVLNAAQSEEALRIVRRLQQRYPFRQLEIHGVRSLEDCASAEAVLHRERRALSDRLLEFTVRHSVALLFSFLLLLSAVAGYFLYKYYYDYPDLERASGATVRTSSIVYNPRAARMWQFRDGAEMKNPVVPCGDLEVGDGYFRNFYVWNFSRFALDVDIGIEGPDADQWYMSWNGGRQRIETRDTLRMMVMYAPTRPGLRKHANLVLRDPDSGEELFHIELTGSSGAPQPAGYALRLDGNDDMLLFGKKSYAFGMETGTMEMWLRPEKMHGCFFSNVWNEPDGQAIENMSLALQGDSLALHVGSYRATVLLSPDEQIGAGKWMHFALAYAMPVDERPGRIAVLINGKVLHDVVDEFMFEDIFQSFVTIGSYFDTQQAGGHFRGDIDELRLWHGFRSPDEIRAGMHRRVPGDTLGLRGYWNFDFLGEESAFVANKRAQEGVPLGRPARVRSTAPVSASPYPDSRIVRGPYGGRALEIQPFRYLHLARQIIASDSARTYAIWFREDGNAVKRDVLVLNNQDASLALRTGEINLLGASRRIPTPREQGWRHVLFRIDGEQRVEVFVDGHFVEAQKSGPFSRGPFYRYVGLQVGGSNDGYNHLKTGYYDRIRPSLASPLAVADLCVWNRRLSEEEIAAVLEGKVPEQGLLARWQMDAMPDAMGNIIDVANGHQLHLLQICGWQ